MRLYSGTSRQFIEDNVQNQIADKLTDAFFRYFRHAPSPGEKNSWRNSLRAMTLVIQRADLLDQGIMLEYQLPLSSKRLDCLICGRDAEKSDSAVIVELKQWERCAPAEGDRVVTWLGGGNREVLHPSVQVGQYHHYLQDYHTAFYEDDPVQLASCTYLHNYNCCAGDPLLEPKFEPAIQMSPLFSAEDVDRLCGHLASRLEQGRGVDVLRRIEQGSYRPSKKLMDHVGSVIKGKPEYVLLDEQLVVYDRVLTSAKRGFHDRQKTMVIVKGGPGTGKSVIAINLMADLSLMGYNAQYATGSRAFTLTLRKIIGSRGSVQFRYFNSYSAAENNDVDVLIADEAHRIRENSASRFQPRSERPDMAQIDELINASKVMVFFIDDAQVVRPGEIGSVAYIKEAGEKRGCKVFEYQLDIQFRCGGSESFIEWVDNTLGIRRTPSVLWDESEEFDFRIMDSPLELENAVRTRVAEGHTGRMTAGFCWPWSRELIDGGLLTEDVVVGEYRRPWNAQPDVAGLAPGIPRSNLWAYDPNGMDQVGCIYTAQGFEFDYVGVIFGRDLRYSWDLPGWEGHPEESADSVVRRAKKDFTGLIKNTYRVLLTRGLKGCYVYFIDDETRKFVKSRMEQRA